MADDVVTNPDTGQTAKWDPTKGDWVVLDSPFSMSGTGKALASGTLHEGFPGLFGAAGDVRDLANRGAAYLVNKIKGTEDTDRAVKPEDIATAASKVGGPAAWVQKAPTSEDIRNSVTRKIAPEYQPQNMYERGANAVGSMLPGALIAPQAELPAAAGLIGKALAIGGRGLNAVGRYAVAPGIASQGVREGFDAAGASDSPFKEPAALAAMLAAPIGANKLITPNPATASQRAFGKTLSDAGATYTPKQLVSGDLQKEADTLKFPGSPLSVKQVNATNTDNYNRATLRTAFGDTLPPGPVRDEAVNATKITDELRGRIDQTIDNEFNRLASAHSMPLTKQLERRLDDVVSRYDNEAILRKSPQLAQDVNDIKDAFQNSKFSGFIDGRQYLNLRSRLSGLANSETDTSMAKGLRALRDELDNSMSQLIAKYYPQDQGAFERAREAYQNKMVVDKAMTKASGPAAKGNLDPDGLAAATRGVVGDEFGSHPLGKLARAGQNVLEPLPPGESSGLKKELPLLGMLAGGAVGAGASHGNPWGTVLGFGLGAAPYATRPLVSQLMGNPLGRKYLANQAVPMEARPAFTRNPANAALIGEALARRKEPNKE